MRVESPVPDDSREPTTQEAQFSLPPLQSTQMLEVLGESSFHDSGFTAQLFFDDGAKVMHIVHGLDSKTVVRLALANAVSSEFPRR